MNPPGWFIGWVMPPALIVFWVGIGLALRWIK